MHLGEFPRTLRSLSANLSSLLGMRALNPWGPDLLVFQQKVSIFVQETLLFVGYGRFSLQFVPSSVSKTGNTTEQSQQSPLLGGFHQDLYKIFSQGNVKDLDQDLHARTPKRIPQDRHKGTCWWRRGS